ncbi:hypothetical protein EDB84DRAFT_1581407 [Lactarius hengduanensis]|nr:hypothetical protein EDB84DRAFT_1581407 [Lactarius hengduanensis]
MTNRDLYADATTNLNTLVVAVALMEVVNAIRPPAPSAAAATDIRMTAMNMIEDEEGFSDNDLARAANCKRLQSLGKSSGVSSSGGFLYTRKST